jgi:integrase
MKFLYDTGVQVEDLSEKILKVHNATRQEHLPSSFSADDVKKLLAVVDRNSPVGKRDYAILLIASTLRFRSGDVRNLRFEHIDWQNNCIRIVQSKTGEPLSLPLLPEAGWALIDYIKHGRPVSDCPEIFVRQVAPHVT